MRQIVNMYVCLIMLLGFFGLHNPEIFAQTPAPDQQLLNDIEILETVLDRLISPDKAQLQFFGATNSRGYYLANYGVIFNVNYSLFNRAIISLDLNRTYKIGENNLIYVDTTEEHEKSSNEFEKELEQLKKSITRFLGTWTSALIELKPDEKITVIVDFNGWFSNFANEYDVNLHQLVAAVPINDIKDYRKNNISDKGFARRINFDEIKSIDEDISILSNVIETALAHENKNVELGLAGNVKGIHFKGYGVIFFTDISYGASLYTRAWSIYTDAAKKAKRRSFTINNFSDEQKGISQDLEKIEQKLINLISNYGHNLRSLQPNEWVEIAINFKGMPVKDKYSRSVLKVRKKVIDDYNRDAIKFDDFKKQVNILYY
jgi:hypothetical protein